MAETTESVHLAIARLRRLAWALVGWCSLLSIVTYLSIRETQRMLCHTRWPAYTDAECATHFTGDTLGHFIALGLGSLTFLFVALASLPDANSNLTRHSSTATPPTS